MKTKMDFLFRVEPPWIYVGGGEAERMKIIPSCFYAAEGLNVCVRQLRGAKMQTTRALMDEFGAAMQFFEGFGENWDALDECLAYLDEWLPADAYVLVIEHAELLLSKEHEDQMSAFLKTLHAVGEWWAKPIDDNGRFNRKAIPFHILLNVSKEASRSNAIVSIANESSIPIRRCN